MKRGPNGPREADGKSGFAGEDTGYLRHPKASFKAPPTVTIVVLPFLAAEAPRRTAQVPAVSLPTVR